MRSVAAQSHAMQIEIELIDGWFDWGAGACVCENGAAMESQSQQSSSQAALALRNGMALIVARIYASGFPLSRE